MMRELMVICFSEFPILHLFFVCYIIYRRVAGSTVCDFLCRLQDTLEQLHHEVKILKTENSVLKSRLSLDQVTATSSGSTSGVVSNPDGERLHLLTKKLQDAQKLYERVKQDINKLKQALSFIYSECVCGWKHVCVWETDWKSKLKASRNMYAKCSMHMIQILLACCGYFLVLYLGQHHGLQTCPNTPTPAPVGQA